MSNRAGGAAGAVLAGLILGGCGVRPTPMLPASAFVQKRPAVGPGSNEPIDEPGTLVYEGRRLPKPLAADGEHISPTVREVVQPPDVEAMRSTNGSDFPPPAPYFFPATRPLAAGTSQTIGGVLVVVNEQPIYADKVLDRLDRALRAEARKRPRPQFLAMATDLVGKEVHAMMDNELEYAAAEKSLEPHDKDLASFLVKLWRRDQVSKAGGSEALARQRFAEEGQDFDEALRQRKRLETIRIYYQQRIYPLIQVSAQDMRDYYRRNHRQFEKPAAARFRVLWIGAAANGGRERALAKARHVYELAASGEDFGDLAARFNDSASLRDTKGVVGGARGWMEKGAFFQPKVEAEVWQLQPGQITAPIDAPYHGVSGFFVAKLDELQRGKVEPFENEKVQSDINAALRRQQLATLRDKNKLDLLNKAAVVEVPGSDLIVREMLMQRYSGWVASR
ncbi:MAG TPA: peptidylprolyl isomerase [Tepidisphaeraceae bacterium]|nr:peptidylprolyl isomerase [Tepidisphaeraceae bacterium]